MGEPRGLFQGSSAMRPNLPIALLPGRVGPRRWAITPVLWLHHWYRLGSLREADVQLFHLRFE